MYKNVLRAMTVILGIIVIGLVMYISILGIIYNANRISDTKAMFPFFYLAKWALLMVTVFIGGNFLLTKV